MIDPARPDFPGFEAAFGIPWKPQPAQEVVIDAAELNRRIHFDDSQVRVFEAVDFYATAILNNTSGEETPADLWFVVLPDDVYQLCRPQSSVASADKIAATPSLSKQDKSAIKAGQGLLFGGSEVDQVSKAYDYEVHFHNQLKARLLEKRIVTQLVRESTIAYDEILNDAGKPLRDLSKMLVDIAWHISTAAFYKSGGRPWKIDAIREGVCYIGVVYKQDRQAKDPRTACCAAQMFLDSGDGVVFKGNNGPWYTGKYGEFHLTEAAAEDLIQRAIHSYKSKKQTEVPPKELFVHARTKFNDAEWQGFKRAAGTSTNVVAVQIQEEPDLKLFRPGRHAVLRGMALPIDDHLGYLWTRGLVPRLRTYVGKEVPNPQVIKVCRGECDIQTVLADILGLTKLNYNACRFADGVPVTLKFADAVGEILTAGPVVKGDIPPLPFKHYV